MTPPHSRWAAALAIAAMILAAVFAAGDPTPPSLRSSDSLAAVSRSWLALGEQHAREERYDLAARELAEAYRLQPSGPEGERAGVLAARALLELGRSEEARPLLEAVAGADTGGFWWGESLLQLARLVPNPRLSPDGFDHKRTPADSAVREAEAVRARAWLEQTIAHFRAGAAADSTWRAALIAAEAELLRRLPSVAELDRALERAVRDAPGAEQEAMLWMAYVDGGRRLLRGDAFLPEKRQADNREVLDHIRRALVRVIYELGETSHAPAACVAHIHLFQDLEIERRLLERYPDSKEALAFKIERHQMEDSRHARIHTTVVRRVPAGDSVRIQVMLDHVARAEGKLIRIDAVEWMGHSRPGGIPSNGMAATPPARRRHPESTSTSSDPTPNPWPGA